MPARFIPFLWRFTTATSMGFGFSVTSIFTYDALAVVTELPAIPKGTEGAAIAVLSAVISWLLWKTIPSLQNQQQEMQKAFIEECNANRITKQELADAHYRAAEKLAKAHEDSTIKICDKLEDHNCRLIDILRESQNLSKQINDEKRQSP